MGHIHLVSTFRESDFSLKAIQNLISAFCSFIDKRIRTAPSEVRSSIRFTRGFIDLPVIGHYESCNIWVIVLIREKNFRSFFYCLFFLLLFFFPFCMLNEFFCSWSLWRKISSQKLHCEADLKKHFLFS